MSQIWLVYDTVKQRQSAPLSTAQVQALLLRVRPKDLYRLHLWSPGWKEWVPVQVYLKTSQKDFVLPPAQMPAPPPLDEEKTAKITAMIEEVTASRIHVKPEEDDDLFTHVSTDETMGKSDQPSDFYQTFNAEHIDPSAQNTFRIHLPKAENKNGDRRQELRHHFKIEVILINKAGRSFRTFSSNISMGGTLLEDELPKEFLNMPFDLILVNKFEKDPVRGRLHFVGKVVGDYRNPRRLMFLEADPHMKARLLDMLKAYSARRKESRRKAG